MQRSQGAMQKGNARTKNHGLTTLESGIGIAIPSLHIPAPVHGQKFSPSKSVPKVVDHKGTSEVASYNSTPKVKVVEILPKELFSKFFCFFDYPEIFPCKDTPKNFPWEDPSETCYPATRTVADAEVDEAYGCGPYFRGCEFPRPPQVRHYHPEDNNNVESITD
jgi:hypothetical protein